MTVEYEYYATLVVATDRWGFGRVDLRALDGRTPTCYLIRPRFPGSVYDEEFFGIESVDR